jgi:hypothetical protein
MKREFELTIVNPLPKPTMTLERPGINAIQDLKRIRT